MTVAEAVRSLLLTLTPVTALVGSRIRLVKIRQSEPTFPVILVQRIDEGEDVHLRGGGPKSARVQVTSIAHESENADWYATAASVEAAVHGPGDGTGLCGYKGSIGSPAFEFRAILPIPRSLREGYDADELKQFKIMRDYEVHFRD